MNSTYGSRVLNLALVFVPLLFLVLLVPWLTDHSPLTPSLHASEVTVTDSQLLSSAIALNTAAGVDRPVGRQCKAWAVYIEWQASTSAGAVQVETARDGAYTGTWAPLGSPIAWTAVTSQTVITFNGVYGAVRTRISTAIAGGGGVNTWILCN